jgi:8-amino-7-oxononanoate synthase
MQDIFDRLQQSLDKKKATHSLRSLTLTDPNLTDFISNNYLGLAENVGTTSLITNILQNYGLAHTHGSTGSRLLAGHSALAADLEEFLAQFYEGESALVMNSGYVANAALLSSIPQKTDVILYDERIHASLKEGARLSFASRVPFQHNNLEHLERKLQAQEKPTFISIESLYSMDGDVAPLAAICQLATDYNAALLLDEAHTTGIIGTEGKGLAIELGLAQQCFARVYTYGKGPGGHGAVIVGDKVLTNYLINTARPFIYTTALPPYSLASIWATTLSFQSATVQRTQLDNNINTYLQAMNGEGNQGSPIQFIAMGSPQKAKEIAKHCQELSFGVKAVVSPTVPEGQEGIRINLHSYNTASEIESLCRTIQDYRNA